MAAVVFGQPGQVLTGGALAIVGAPGAGKTSVGRELAARAHAPFIDADAEVEREAGMDLGELFAVQGDAAVRARQRAAVLTAVTQPEAVVAVSSGAILDADVRDALAAVPVLWLRVDATHSSRRSGLSAVAPAFFAGMRARMVAEIAERDPLYAAVADHTVDTSALPLADVIARAADLTGVGSPRP